MCVSVCESTTAFNRISSWCFFLCESLQIMRSLTIYFNELELEQIIPNFNYFFCFFSKLIFFKCYCTQSFNVIASNAQYLSIICFTYLFLRFHFDRSGLFVTHIKIIVFVFNLFSFRFTNMLLQLTSQSAC